MSTESEQSAEAEEGPFRTVPTRAAFIGGLVLLIVGLLAAKVPLCPFAITTHHPCPGCGLTRASLAILRGDFATGFAIHPFAFLATPLLGFIAAVTAWNYVRLGRLKMPWVSSWIFGVLFVGMVSLWVARFFGVHGGPVPV